MEPVAVTVEVIFGEIFVPFYTVVLAEDFGFLPSFRLDTNELDVAGVIVFSEEGMPKLMKEFERVGVGGVIDS